MASNTARISVVRGRPPALAGGMWGDTSAHCGSVRSEGYRLRRMLASMPLLSTAILQRQTRHFAHGLLGEPQEDGLCHDQGLRGDADVQEGLFTWWIDAIGGGTEALRQPAENRAL